MITISILLLVMQAIHGHMFKRLKVEDSKFEMLVDINNTGKIFINP